MRRGSVVGPLILIVIGALFLINNLRPELSVLDLLARYWPLLLILWGTLRLVEILWSFRRPGVTTGGLSGGEWALVIFVCLIGSGAYFTREHFGSSPWARIRGVEMFGEPYDYPLETRSVPARGVSRIVIENYRGNTRIMGADAPEVKVSGRKTVRAMQQKDAEEGNRMTPLELLPNGDSLLIRTNQDRWRRDQYVSADLEITVPKGVSVEARGRLGDFEVNDLNGAVDIVSDNAGIRVQNIAGNFRANTRRSDIIRAVHVKGEVELKGRGENVELEDIEGQVLINGAYSGDLDFRKLAKPLRFEGSQSTFRVERCPGQIRMARGYLTAEDVVGPVRVTAHSKDVQLSGFTQSLDVNVDRGDVELRPGKLPVGKMDVTSRSGHIELALPEGAKFVLKAAVQKGEVQNNFGNALQVSNEGRGGTIIGAVGEGPSISLSTDRGSVTVRKASGADALTPAPPPFSVNPPLPPVPHGRGHKIEDIVERHADKLEQHLDQIGRRLEDAGKRIESEAEDAQRRAERLSSKY